MYGAPNLATVRPGRVRARADGLRSYLCIYHPIDRDGLPVANESNHLPSVRVRARSNEEAHRKAYKQTGNCPIAEVQRLEERAS
ncbi:hypothetical protein [Variovorax sp.]|jgi:hypothetical protein|uniref:hypothetical protein n=1 Tax=Variovorax sp. TaxID=1871043 RepID=UPI004037CA89